MRFSPPEPLVAARHDIKAFSCGEPQIERWLREYAGQNTRRDLSRTFVSLDESGAIAGFYALSFSAMDVLDVTADVRHRLPSRGVIPAALIGQLAVSSVHQGKGLGASLLSSALERIVTASETFGVRAVVVDAISDDAARFYERFGFAQGPTPGRLMIPTQTVRGTIGSIPNAPTGN